jgi:hypothetical protein
LFAVLSLNLRKQVVKIVSAFMLVVFLLGVMPKEYLHGWLYQHTDTEHPIYKKGEFVIGDKHTHCQFLAFALAPFVATPFFVFQFRQAVVYTENSVQFYSYLFSVAHGAVSLRGPPVALFI